MVVGMLYAGAPAVRYRNLEGRLDIMGRRFPKLLFLEKNKAGITSAVDRR